MELLLPVVPEVVDLIVAVLPVLHPLLHPILRVEAAVPDVRPAMVVHPEVPVVEDNEW